MTPTVSTRLCGITQLNTELEAGTDVIGTIVPEPALQDDLIVIQLDVGLFGLY
jgi:hypothetical protein